MSPKPPSPSSRYRPISRHYRERFGCKVYKISVAVAQSCPNREGMRGMRVCAFCDPWGSAAYEENASLTLREQIRNVRSRLRKRYKAEKFLVYFQAFTTTFHRISRLRALFEDALREADVVGIVVGTRPDCLSPAMVKLLAEFAGRCYVSVELGVQSLDDGQLRFLSRGHDAACSLAAVESLRAYPQIDICAHLMFGLPGETMAQLETTAEVLSAAGVHGVKLHNLHVLRNTALEARYRAGTFQPIGLEAYSERVCAFLEHLSPEVAVHRLNAVASRWDQLVAPDWAREKMRPTQFILDEMERRDLRQGARFQGGRLPPGAGPVPSMAAIDPGGAGIPAGEIRSFSNE